MSVGRFVAASLLLPLFAGAGIRSAAAQVAASTDSNIQPLVIDITVRFNIADKILPPGRYVIEQEARDLLVFRPASGKGQMAEAPVLTRLAKPPQLLGNAEVIFDKVNDDYYISEVWLPGIDGFLLGGIKEPHTHQRARTTKK